MANQQDENKRRGDVGVHLWLPRRTDNVYATVRLHITPGNYGVEQARMVARRILGCCDLAEGKEPQKGGA